MEDADGDGIKDTDKYGCDLSASTDTQQSGDDQTIDPDADDDGDGIANKNDLCPDTIAGGLTDLDGCSSDQLGDQAEASDGKKDTTGSNTMLVIMLVAAIFTAGAFLILKQLESKASQAKDLVSLEEQEMMLVENSEAVDTEEWAMPVLDGSSTSSGDDAASSEISAEDMAKFPGWGIDVVQRYIDSGWTIEQLAEYYQEQLQDNQ